MTLPDLYTAAINQSPVKTEKAPEELIKFRSLQRHLREQEEKNGFFKQKFIEEYLEKKWKAELNNKKWFEMLYDIYVKKDIYAQTQEKLDKVIYKLSEFKDSILSNEKPFRSLVINFLEYPFKEMHKPSGSVEVTGWE